MTIRNLYFSFLGSFVAFVILLTGMFITGQTFGQRCEWQYHYEWGSEAWNNCVKELSDDQKRYY